MPTKRTRRTRNRKPDIDPLLWAYLSDQPPPDGSKSFASLWFDHDEATIERWWRQYSEEILARWAEEQPGTRPTQWWRHDAPRWLPTDERDKGACYVSTLPEPRRRLGGTGTPSHEVLAYVPHWPLGLPLTYVEKSDVEIYGRRFKGVPIDPDDPPTYEAQATYLERHELLLPGECERLADTDFEPEQVVP